MLPEQDTADDVPQVHLPLAGSPGVGTSGRGAGRAMSDSQPNSRGERSTPPARNLATRLLPRSTGIGNGVLRVYYNNGTRPHQLPKLLNPGEEFGPQAGAEELGRGARFDWSRQPGTTAG